MTAPTTPCPRCTRGTTDGLLCHPCVAVYERAVGDLARLEHDLAVVVARLDETTKAVQHRRYTDRETAPAAVSTPTRTVNAALRTRTPTTALVAHAAPVNLDAVDLARTVTRVVSQWDATLYATVRRRQLRGPVCELSCEHLTCGILRWQHRAQLLTAAPPTVRLLAATWPLRRHPAATACVADMVRLARTVERFVDRREPDTYCGPCDAPDVKLLGGTIELGTCGVDMYARLGDKVVTCTACGARYAMSTRRGWLLDEVREVYARPGLIATALAAMDVDLTAARLDTWISRDKRRHQRDCVARRPVGPVCAAYAVGDGCVHVSCGWSRARPWQCWRGHILPMCDENGAEVSDRPLYRVGDVLARVDALRAQRDATAAAAAELEEAPA